MQGRAAEARLTHNQKVGGSNASPASIYLNNITKYTSFPFETITEGIFSFN